jgi:threonine aldolase
MIDLRSDTVTKPTLGMRKAMSEAEVGDDVFGEDPTVRRLEERVAELLGKEAALFVTSGTMGNQLAIRCQTHHGDEVLVGEDAHPIHYEGAAAAALSGVQFGIIGKGGLFTADELEAAIRPAAYWAPRPALVCVENTHNRGGGAVFPLGDMGSVVERAHKHGLRAHLDGARLWNASVRTGVGMSTLSDGFDTVTVCFSKGLGAPVGSVLAGRRDLVTEARRVRKMWGGAMRQSGILAAAALYALDYHVTRLADDHAHASLLCERLAEVKAFVVSPAETNIVVADLAHGLSADDVVRVARTRRVLLNPVSPTRLRMVTHLDVAREQIEEAARALREVARELGADVGST